MAQAKITEARLRLIHARQFKDRWGANYLASIFATPQEAPSVSRPSILTPAKLGGRDFHCLSNNETGASLLALYNDKLWELHEQRMMYPKPRVHYLYGHARCGGMQFPALRGTLDVAERLGILAKHPRVRIGKAGDLDNRPLVPFPYIGDLLLFLLDDQGSYALNWSIKDKQENFRRQGPRPFGQPQAHGDDESVIIRQLLEATYYSDGAIRTHQVAGEDIDEVIWVNLSSLFLAHRNDVSVCDEGRERLVDFYRSAVGADIKIHDLIQEAAGRFAISEEDGLNVLRQGIWQRKIRVDLFRRLLNDRPLRPEVEDVLVRYASWFAR